jgi:hypothetical protein
MSRIKNGIQVSHAVLTSSGTSIAYRLLFLTVTVSLYIPSIFVSWTDPFKGPLNYSFFSDVAFWIAIVLFFIPRFLSAGILAIVAFGVSLIEALAISLFARDLSDMGWLACVVGRPLAMFLILIESCRQATIRPGFVLRLFAFPVIYGLYIPFFFVRPLFMNPHAGGLGPDYGYEQFIPLNMWPIIYVCLLLSGDLEFWIASVLFVTGRFGAAQLMAIIALGGAVLLTCELLSNSDLSEMGLLFGVITRPLAFFLLVGAASLAKWLTVDQPLLPVDERRPPIKQTHEATR